MKLFFGTNAIFGGIVGFIFTRHWVGAVMGALVGAYIDGQQKMNSEGQSQTRNFRGGSQYQRSYQPNMGGNNLQHEFSRALLILSAAVIKADGKILKSELNFVKQFLVQQFGKDLAQEYLLQFKTILNTSNNLNDTCAKINHMMQPQQRLMLIQYLFGIAQSDGNVSKHELDSIKRIASLLGIADYKFEQVKSMFWKDASNDYKILGVSKDVSDQDIKKAYRKMAIEHHPDKVANLGDQHQKAAKEQFQKIQEAYENIKRERGF